MIQEILQQIYEICQIVFNKTVLFLSMIIGIFLSAIGYPKEILLIIVAMSVIDLITKHYSIVKIHYKEFTLKTYCLAWKNRQLKSRIMKNHICIKTILYSFVFFIANQCEILPQIIGGKSISSILYTGLLLTEAVSIFENFIEAGHLEMLPYLKYFKKTSEKVFSTTEQKDSSDNK